MYSLKSEDNHLVSAGHKSSRHVLKVKHWIWVEKFCHYFLPLMLFQSHMLFSTFSVEHKKRDIFGVSSHSDHVF